VPKPTPAPKPTYKKPPPSPPPAPVQDDEYSYGLPAKPIPAPAPKPSYKKPPPPPPAPVYDEEEYYEPAPSPYVYNKDGYNLPPTAKQSPYDKSKQYKPALPPHLYKPPVTKPLLPPPYYKQDPTVVTPSPKNDYSYIHPAPGHGVHKHHAGDHKAYVIPTPTPGHEYVDYTVPDPSYKKHAATYPAPETHPAPEQEEEYDQDPWFNSGSKQKQYGTEKQYGAEKQYGEGEEEQQQQQDPSYGTHHNQQQQQQQPEVIYYIGKKNRVKKVTLDLNKNVQYYIPGAKKQKHTISPAHAAVATAMIDAALDVTSESAADADAATTTASIMRVDLGRDDDKEEKQSFHLAATVTCVKNEAVWPPA
jgi:hypothetical protein